MTAVECCGGLRCGDYHLGTSCLGSLFKASLIFIRAGLVELSDLRFPFASISENCWENAERSLALLTVGVGRFWRPSNAPLKPGNGCHIQFTSSASDYQSPS